MQMSSEVYPEPYIYTSKGTTFYLNKPEFDIEVMAHSLSLLCRFNGHIKYLYTVAQHSMMVADIAQQLALSDGKSWMEADEVALEGLMHDGTEAYLSDVPAPFKPQLPDWKGVDSVLEFALREQHMIAQAKSPYVKLADWYALFIEAEVLLPEGIAAQFVDPDNYRTRALEFQKHWHPHYVIRPADPAADEADFLDRYRWLVVAAESVGRCPF